MYLTVKLHIKINKILQGEFLNYESIFKSEVNRIANIFHENNKYFEYRYKNISNDISYNSKYLILFHAKEKYNSEKQGVNYVFPFSSVWGNLSYQIVDDGFLLEMGLCRKREKIFIPCYISEQQRKRLNNGRNTNLKLINRNGKWHALILVDVPIQHCTGINSMGIDIGLKVPAVVALSTGQIKFFGNGRQMRFFQRKYRSHIESMLRHHQLKKVKKFQHKLRQIMDDFDHKISKQIIEYAVENQVSVIIMENLMSINKKYEKSKNKELHQWSYRRLQDYIEYKAKLLGIKVVYINPYNTSKKCPKCGRINYPKDRLFQCSCGYKGHRDVVAALNILHAL